MYQPVSDRGLAEEIPSLVAILLGVCIAAKTATAGPIPTGADAPGAAPSVIKVKAGSAGAASAGAELGAGGSNAGSENVTGFGPRTVEVDGAGVSDIISIAPAAGPGTGAWIRVPPPAEREVPTRQGGVQAVQPSALPPAGLQRLLDHGRAMDAIDRPRAHPAFQRPMPKPDRSEPATPATLFAQPAAGASPIPAPALVAPLPSLTVPAVSDRDPKPARPDLAAPAGPATSPVEGPVMREARSIVGAPVVPGELGNAKPRRYGGRTMLDLVLLLVQVFCVIAAVVGLYWGVAGLRDQLALRRAHRRAARVEATRRRIAAVTAARRIVGP